MGTTILIGTKVNRYGIPRKRIGYLKNLKCKRFLGSIIINDKKYCLDQISDEDNVWFYHKSEYLMKTYGITIEQYYRLCMYGSVFTVPICKYCGKQLQFRELNYGYYPVCSKKDCKTRYRSEGSWLRTEKMLDMASKKMTMYNKSIWDSLNKNERSEKIKKNKTKMSSDFKSHLSVTRKNKSLLSRICNKVFTTSCKMIGRELTSLAYTKDYKIVCRWTKEAFMTYGEPNDICEFYIATAGNKFKFGISHNSDYRAKSAEYDNIKVIFRSSRINIAELEYLIKMDLKISKEYIDWSRVSEFRKSYNNHIDKFKLTSSQS